MANSAARIQTAEKAELLANTDRSEKDSGPVSRTTEKAGHPRGLYTLFGAEAWERFSYYGLRALLVLYLVKRIGLPRSEALAIYGLYTGLVYLTPLLGGYLADKVLGRRK